MEDERKEHTRKTRPTTKSVSQKNGSGQDEAVCRCKEAQGKGITDFLKVMVDDLSFWRKKS